MNFITRTKQGIFRCLAFCLSVMTWSVTSAQENPQSLPDSLAADTASAPRVSWYASVTTEMPWNISDGRVGWANYIEAGAEIGLWKADRSTWMPLPRTNIIIRCSETCSGFPT